MFCASKRFSACRGVYARLDLHDGVLDGETIGLGTTNVDVNPALRKLLAGVDDASPLTLGVGTEALAIEVAGVEVVEERVALPVSWIKGLAETYVAQRGMTPVFTLTAGDARAFIRSLPKTSTRGKTWIVSSGRTIRLTPFSTPGAVPCSGPERLRAIDDLLPHVTSCTAYREIDAAEEGSSAWRFDLPGGAFWILLSPAADRGFSGEGRVLDSLTDDRAWAAADRLGDHLAWQSALQASDLGAAIGLSVAETEVGAGCAQRRWRRGIRPLEGSRIPSSSPLRSQPTRPSESTAPIRAGPRIEERNQLVR